MIILRGDSPNSKMYYDMLVYGTPFRWVGKSELNIKVNADCYLVANGNTHTFLVVNARTTCGEAVELVNLDILITHYAGDTNK